MGAYLYFDNYVDLVIRQERQNIAKSWREGHTHGYNMGHYDGYKEGCDYTIKEINAG
jgi:flagellar biosynthesis/type III secretory pathway protein FliH